jgi:hypothetical protein
MEQTIESLVASIERIGAKTDANLKEMREEMRAGHEELLAVMKAGHKE